MLQVEILRLRYRLLLFWLAVLCSSGSCSSSTQFMPPGTEIDGVEESLFGVDWEFPANPRLIGRRVSTIDAVQRSLPFQFPDFLACRSAGMCNHSDWCNDCR